VIDVEHRRRFTAQQSLQPRFPLDQWQRPPVFAIQEEQVEGEEDTISAAEQQIVEHRTARVIDAGDPAIEDSVFDPQVSADPLRQMLEVAERVPVARDEITLAVLDVGERSKAIDLQFVDEFIGVPGELQISPEFGGFRADAYHLFMRYTKR